MESETDFVTSPLFDQSAFRRDLLILINDMPGKSGRDIKAALENYYGKEIGSGRLYPNLDQLVNTGLVSKGSADERTNSYKLTTRGQRELRAHLDWERKHAGQLID